MIPYLKIKAAQELEDIGNYKEAAALVQQYTLNSTWYKQLIIREISREGSLNQESASNRAEALAEDWSNQTAEQLGEKLQSVRARHFAATQEQNFSQIAKTAMEEGKLYTLNGNYRQALLLYRQARSADLSMELESLFHATQIHMIQRDWSMVISSLSRFATTHLSKGGLWRQLACCFAFASWNLGDYCNCVTTLLGVNNSHALFLAAATDDENAAMLWLTQEAFDVVLVLSAMLAFSRDDLKLACGSDTALSQALDRNSLLKELVKAFTGLEISKFWKHWNLIVDQVKSQWQMSFSLAQAESELVNAIYGLYLAVRSRVRVSTVLSQFSYQSIFQTRTFTYRDLEAIADRVSLSLDIDLVNDVLEIKPMGHDLVEIQQNFTTQTANFAYWLWSHHDLSLLSGDLLSNDILSR